MGRHHKHHTQHGIPGAASRVSVVAAAIGLGLGATGFTGAAMAAPAAPAPAAPAPAGAAAPTAHPERPPCAEQIKACVSISKHEAWLTDGHGHTIDGPVQVTTGAKGQNTPTGQFVVQWKDKNHHSSEYGGAPMPYSVFFDTHGRAFHEGNLGRDSGGCVHLSHHDAVTFFNDLNPNDRVQILP